VPKILICVGDGIGNVVMSTPLIDSLYQMECVVDVLGCPNFPNGHHILKNRPEVRSVFDTLEDASVVEVNDEANSFKMSAQEAISSWEKEPEFTPLGWEAIDVDESKYFVVFNYSVNSINQLWAFHVVPKDGIVERIELGEDGLDGHRYMSRIISTSSYAREELEVKLKRVFKRLMFQ